MNIDRKNRFTNANDNDYYYFAFPAVPLDNR